MKSYKLILILLLSILINQGCNISKQYSVKQSIAKSKTACLTLYPTTYNCVKFNPDWIVENKIQSIIEREYLDGKDGKVHLVTILEYNSDGYLEFKHSGLSYPNDDSPNKEDIFSRWEYETEKLDSFVVHSSKIVRFQNENGKMEKPDTLRMGGSIFNTKKAKVFINDKHEVVRSYEYDNLARLIAEKDSKGESRFNIVYHDNKKIEIIKFSRWKNKDFSSWITLDKNGRIVQSFDESNNSTHKFKYDDYGRMIEEKHWFKGEKPNYHTYEYIKKNLDNKL